MIWRRVLNSKTNGVLISELLKQKRHKIKENFKCLETGNKADQVDMLCLFLSGLLTRGLSEKTRIETRGKVREAVTSLLFYKQGEVEFKKALRGYKFGSSAAWNICSQAAQHIQEEYGSLLAYVLAANKNKEVNFAGDKLLDIQHVTMKRRDLALSNFCSNFIMFDVYAPRALTRIGILKARDLSIPTSSKALRSLGVTSLNKKQYLLSQVASKLAEEYKVKPVEIGLGFKLLGKAKCKSTPVCNACNLQQYCEMGKSRGNQP
jgi:endonuclease III